MPDERAGDFWKEGKDLVIPEGKTVHITTPEDTLIFHIAEYANNGEDEVAEDSDADAAKA